MKKDNKFDEIEVPAGLESRLETLIDQLAEKEKQSKWKSEQIRLWIVSAAASIALLISVGVLFYSKNGNEYPVASQKVNTIKNPEIACREAQKALVLVSRNFNKGMGQLAIVTDEIEKSNRTLNKTLKR
ncbi:MAG: hypothetical protein LBO74_18010 [Candidatus Symbiothrix sp.]|jgi:hypothetical protein|nr:hypothetical protein [Candidatus Symbiothrix sp.]